MASTIGELLLKISADSAQLRSELGKASNEVKGFVKNISSSLGQIKQLMFFDAIAQGVERMAEFVSSSADAAQKLSNLSLMLGVTVEDMTRWAYAARQVGMTQEELALNFERLSRNMEYALTGEGKQAQAFASLHINVLNSNKTLRSAIDVAKDIADQFQGMENGAGKTALAVMMMGREGAALLPILNQGRAGIEKWLGEADKMARTISTDVVGAATRFNQDINKLRGGMEVLGITLAAKLEPAFSSWLKSIDAGSTQVSAFEVLADKMATGLKLLAGTILLVESGIERLAIRWTGLKRTLAADGWENARNEMYKTYKALEDEERRYNNAMNALGMGKSQFGDTGWGTSAKPLGPGEEELNRLKKTLADAKAELKKMEDADLKVTIKVNAEGIAAVKKDMERYESQIKTLLERPRSGGTAAQIKDLQEHWDELNKTLTAYERDGVRNTEINKKIADTQLELNDALSKGQHKKVRELTAALEQLNKAKETGADVPKWYDPPDQSSFDRVNKLIEQRRLVASLEETVNRYVEGGPERVKLENDLTIAQNKLNEALKEGPNWYERSVLGAGNYEEKLLSLRNVILGLQYDLKQLPPMPTGGIPTEGNFATSASWDDYVGLRPAPIPTDNSKAESALKQLESRIAALKEKTATLGWDESAQMRWSVQFGTLAALLDLVGGKAEGLRRRLIEAGDAYAEALAAQKTEADSGDAFKKLTEEVDRQRLSLMKVADASEVVRMEFEISEGSFRAYFDALRASGKGAVADALTGMLRHVAVQKDQQKVFEDGKKAAEALNAEATKLGESTAALAFETERDRTAWSLANGELKKYVDQMEAAGMSADHLRTTLIEQADIYDKQKRIAEAIRDAKQEYEQARGPAQKYADSLELLNSPAVRAALTQGQLAAALAAARKEFEAAGGKMSEFTQSVSKNMQTAFADGMMKKPDTSAIDAAADQYARAIDKIPASASAAFREYMMQNDPEIRQAAENLNRVIEQQNKSMFEKFTDSLGDMRKAWTDTIQRMLMEALAADLLGALGLGPDGGLGTSAMNKLGQSIGVGGTYAGRYSSGKGTVSGSSGNLIGGAGGLFGGLYDTAKGWLGFGKDTGHQGLDASVGTMALSAEWDTGAAGDVEKVSELESVAITTAQMEVQSAQFQSLTVPTAQIDVLRVGAIETTGALPSALGVPEYLKTPATEESGGSVPRYPWVTSLQSMGENAVPNFTTTDQAKFWAKEQYGIDTRFDKGLDEQNRLRYFQMVAPSIERSADAGMVLPEYLQFAEETWNPTGIFNKYEPYFMGQAYARAGHAKGTAPDEKSIWFNTDAMRGNSLFADYAWNHELGHVASTPERRDLTEQEKALAFRVSDYAATNNQEFIAEVFANTAMTGPFDKDVMDQYAKLGGAAIPKLGGRGVAPNGPLGGAVASLNDLNTQALPGNGWDWESSKQGLVDAAKAARDAGYNTDTSAYLGSIVPHAAGEANDMFFGRRDNPVVDPLIAGTRALFNDTTYEKERQLLREAKDARNPGVMSVIPEVSKPVNEQIYTEDMSNAAMAGPIAWHGSPHMGIQKFSLDKVGTGQGASTFGHGIYSAQESQVAGTYRDMAGAEYASYDGLELIGPRGDPRALWYSSSERKNVPAGQRMALDTITNDIAQYPYIGDDPLIAAQERISRARGQMKLQLQQEREALQKKGELGDAPGESTEWIKNFEDSIDFLTKMDPSKLNVERGGSLYKVDIQTDVEKLLDWDKRLSDQSDYVRTQLKDAGLLNHLSSPEGYTYGDPKGEVIYRSLAVERGGEAAASQTLNEAGIPGHQYLDGKSRGGTGTHNYVTYDPDIIKILEENGQPRVDQILGPTYHPGFSPQDTQLPFADKEMSFKSVEEAYNEPGAIADEFDYHIAANEATKRYGQVLDIEAKNVENTFDKLNETTKKKLELALDEEALRKQVAEDAYKYPGVLGGDMPSTNQMMDESPVDYDKPLAPQWAELIDEEGYRRWDASNTRDPMLGILGYAGAASKKKESTTGVPYYLQSPGETSEPTTPAEEEKGSWFTLPSNIDINNPLGSLQSWGMGVGIGKLDKTVTGAAKDFFGIGGGGLPKGKTASLPGIQGLSADTALPQIGGPDTYGFGTDVEADTVKADELTSPAGSIDELTAQKTQTSVFASDTGDIKAVQVDTLNARMITSDESGGGAGGLAGLGGLLLSGGGLPTPGDVDSAIPGVQDSSVPFGGNYVPGGVAGPESYLPELEGFATGGRPRVGVPAIIGEEGPEIWVPDSAGTIIPNDELGKNSILSSLWTAANEQIDLHSIGGSAAPGYRVSGQAATASVSNDELVRALSGAIKTGPSGTMQVQLDPRAMNMTLREWLEGEFARIASQR